jgi:hypothetical protein
MANGSTKTKKFKLKCPVPFRHALSEGPAPGFKIAAVQFFQHYLRENAVLLGASAAPKLSYKLLVWAIGVKILAATPDYVSSSAAQFRVRDGIHYVQPRIGVGEQ